MRIKKEKPEVLQQTIYSRKETGKWKIRMMKLLALTLYLLAIITLALISSLAITGSFRRVSFEEFNLIILNFESSAFVNASCELFEKYAVWCGNIALVKIRESLLCARNRCIKWQVN